MNGLIIITNKFHTTSKPDKVVFHIQSWFSREMSFHLTFSGLQYCLSPSFYPIPTKPPSKNIFSLSHVYLPHDYCFYYFILFHFLYFKMFHEITKTEKSIKTSLSIHYSFYLSMNVTVFSMSWKEYMITYAFWFKNEVIHVWHTS